MQPKKYLEQLPRWVALYNSGLNCYQIAETTGHDHRKVWLYLKNAGMVFRPRASLNKKHQINEAAFDQLTPTSVYWLGVLYGDGNLGSLTKYKSYTIGLCGHSDDAEHGRRFLEFLGATTYPIRFRKDKKAYQVVVSSKKLYERLMALGLYSNKSNTIPFPTWVTEDLLPYFVLGLFDTDGCICVRARKRYVTKQGTFSIVMNTGFVKTLAGRMHQTLGLRKCVRPCKNTHGVTSGWSVEGLNKLRTLYHWLYPANAPMVYLNRKHDKFAELVKNPS